MREKSADWFEPEANAPSADEQRGALSQAAVETKVDVLLGIYL